MENELSANIMHLIVTPETMVAADRSTYTDRC
jgi:hypothetical protein